MSNPFDQDWTKPAPPAQPTAFADITVIFDRSASMDRVKEAVVEGFNDQVRKMRETPGDSRWTVNQFDDWSSAAGAGESFPQTLFASLTEREVPFLRLANPGPINRAVPEAYASGTPVYCPRGNTALVDAVCITLDQIRHRISGKEDYCKPILIVFTDGEENQSRQHSSDDLRTALGEFQSKGGSVLYFGANVDAFIEARKYNTNQQYTGGMMAYGSGGQFSFNPDASPVNNFVATKEGMREAIASGMVGAAHIVSGSIDVGALNSLRATQ